MIVIELSNNKYLCTSIDEEIYAPNQEAAIRRCKKKRRNLVLNILTDIKTKAWNRGDKQDETDLDEIIQHIKDMI